MTWEDEVRMKMLTDIPTSPMNYDQGAGDYAAHRRIHGGVLHELSWRTRIGSGCRVLEVGCGSGNYLRALATRFGCKGCGLDPSTSMLAHARRGGDRLTWVLGRAERLAFVDDSFDLLFSVDMIHHVHDREAFFREAMRTLGAGGRICTVTDSADIIRQRPILSGYFPETVKVELARYPRIDQIGSWMLGVGLVDVEVITVEEHCQVTSSQPFRDRAYSSLYLISERALQAGLERLDRDLAQVPIQNVSRYACVWGSKPPAQG